MEERLTRRPREEQLSRTRLRVLQIGEMLSSGGIVSLGRVPEERIIEIESRGFDRDKIQRYIDRLEINGETTDAAMLRGAFNDLLSRIPDSPETET